uniref:Uncharacterized protein n=1 Tax=Arundo donax TaxID=35708 RepID=A0A0A8Z8C9_ARUDO
MCQSKQQQLKSMLVHFLVYDKRSNVCKIYPYSSSNMLHII